MWAKLPERVVTSRCIALNAALQLQIGHRGRGLSLHLDITGTGNKSCTRSTPPPPPSPPPPPLLTSPALLCPPPLFQPGGIRSLWKQGLRGF
ncbi:hypothetical protein EYF80_025479 [Liparis tanakae]|uniref:Uncharacterized protein n=1 Tax=Liparis tanakae TaxID=230148 RepID=A0A4Z2HEU5_9TELE|nr:hypothetical protein EYF80_025479 [Liparis tanakae]